MLEDQGFGVGGNLGPPALDLLTVVLPDTSLSYQLSTGENGGKRFEVAAITNISKTISIGIVRLKVCAHKTKGIQGLSICRFQSRPSPFPTAGWCTVHCSQ
ncbi:MAG: hypothetical protein Ct9H300mP8_09550 [Gammaproteobacteria bacterium]|nr:MAG: hypothetical protein Ct9H300mP8_09550 [Gammaproteobacteria bacterium]